MPDYSYNSTSLAQAVNDFHAARRKANIENVLDFLRGRSSHLLSYDEVRQKFRTTESARRTLEDIPIDQIVGSVNRYTDFSRSFLPQKASDAQRWANVRIGMTAMLGLPPIEAYKVGEVYFILDGHHRVSVAKDAGATSIEGYVQKVHTRVPLTPGDSPDDIIIKSEYDEFLFKTRLDESRPDANLMGTAPGQYRKLFEHIAVHQYFMGQNRGHPVDTPEAVADWYDTVYLPVVQMIRNRNMLRDFPNRTETDLYLWILDHAASLSGMDEIGWEVRPDLAAADLVRRYSPTPQRALPRMGRRIIDWLVPDSLESGPPPGQWRSEHISPHRDDRMFDDILVTVPGTDRGWPAVHAAIEVARREEARLVGLHVVAKGSQRDEASIEGVRSEFLRLCSEAGIAARLIVEAGPAAEMLCRRSSWVDMVVFRMNYPPPSQPLQRLRSGSRLIIRRCQSPALAVPDAPLNLSSALLAYGPGRKADEALYVATYAAGRWQIPLTVLTVETTSPGDETAAERAEHARAYLESHGVHAQYITEKTEEADAATAILLNAEYHNAGLLIMGGYESSPLLESLKSSTVDRVLRSTRRPVLICR